MPCRHEIRCPTNTTKTRFTAPSLQLPIDISQCSRRWPNDWKVNELPEIDLTVQQRGELLQTLAAFVPPIERVDVYGSRAGGIARPGSDVDLVLAGPIDWSKLSRIRGAIEDSYLSIFADVAAYQLLEADGFRDQVVATAVTLFDRDELLLARDAGSRAA